MLTRRSRSSRSSTRAGAFRGASHHLLSISSVGAFLALIAQGLTSCGSDDDGGTACEPNVLRACAGPGNCAGNQTCASDGSGYSECSCGGGNAGSAGAGGSSGGSSGGGAAGTGPVEPEPLFDPAERAVGAPCASDAQCPVGPGGETPLTCVSATTADVFGTGGPQGGYCTARCRSSAECQALDGLSACSLIDEAGDGYCVSLCQAGASGLKCPTDRAQACLPPPAGSTNNVGVCAPICQSDSGCGEGLFCNQLCSSTPPVGGDIGAACTEATEATDCKGGLCLTLDTDPPVSFCSSLCTFGSYTNGCGFNPASGVPQEAYCAQPTTLDGGVGDLGICVELCDEAADCGQAGWECVDLTPEGQELLGRFGECVPPGTLATLPDAGAP